MRPDTRKQVDPNTSGRQTNRSYDGSDSAVCSARKVVALKKIVPANWIAAAHHAARPAPASRRCGTASTACIAPAPAGAPPPPPPPPPPPRREQQRADEEGDRIGAGTDQSQVSREGTEQETDGPGGERQGHPLRPSGPAEPPHSSPRRCTPPGPRAVGRCRFRGRSPAPRRHAHDPSGPRTSCASPD